MLLSVTKIFRKKEPEDLFFFLWWFLTPFNQFNRRTCSSWYSILALSFQSHSVALESQLCVLLQFLCERDGVRSSWWRKASWERTLVALHIAGIQRVPVGVCNVDICPVPKHICLQKCLLSFYVNVNRSFCYHYQWGFSHLSGCQRGSKSCLSGPVPLGVSDLT